MTESGGSIFDPEVFVPTQGFMGCPNSYELSGAKLAILGMPFDCGRHPVRVGARQGPFAIREQSALVRPYLPPTADFNPLTALGVVDCRIIRHCSDGNHNPKQCKQRLQRLDS